MVKHTQYCESLGLKSLKFIERCYHWSQKSLQSFEVEIDKTGHSDPLG